MLGPHTLFREQVFILTNAPPGRMELFSPVKAVGKEQLMRRLANERQRPLICRYGDSPKQANILYALQLSTMAFGSGNGRS